MKNSLLHRPVFLARKKQRGFTLAEIAIVLGIVGIIIAAIWVAAQSVNGANDANQAAQELQTVSQNLLTLYEGRTSSWPPASVGGCAAPDITGNAISGGSIPASAATGTCSAAHAWSSAPKSFVVYEIAGGFRLAYYNVPTQGCVGLLMQATGCDPSQAGCPIAVYTGGVYDTLPAPNKATPTGTPASWQSSWTIGTASLNPVTAATTLCNKNAAPNSGGDNSVEFDFKL